MNEKSKKGFGNFLTVVGIIFIIVGILYSIDVGLDKGATTSFFSCLTGTILTLIGGYLREGYFKFFN
jgi:hypothetical protein